jgi:hypothetical protein
MQNLLHLYRERSGDPSFWGEPINAVTNASFVLAALTAWDLASRLRVLTESSWILIVLAASIGVGSFLFHTCATHSTMWLDIVPISLFQVAFLWLAGRYMVQLPTAAAIGLIVTVIGLSFAAMPFHKLLNGSLFYLPPLLAIAGIGLTVFLQRGPEPFLLPLAATVFAVAIFARSIDWNVSFSCGTHFLWHLLNGLVLYLSMRAWIVHLAVRAVAAEPRS